MVKVATGSDTGTLPANLIATGAFGQQMVKAATSTPSEPGAGQAGFGPRGVA